MAQDEEALTRAALPLLRIYAEHMGRRLGRHLEVDELFSLGLPVVTDAVRRFDPTRSSFRAYLLRRLRWAFASEVRKRARQKPTAQLDRSPGLASCSLDRPRQESRGGHGGSLLHLGSAPASAPGGGGGDLVQIAACPKEDPERALMRTESDRAVRGALSSLPEPQRRLLERHYFAGERFDHLAAEIGISKATICRLHKRAMARLGAELRRRGLWG
jgi:RNA polymerase sigma factor for flagellar operon FliA